MRKFTTRDRQTGEIRFWRHTGTTLETHKRGEKWRIVEDNLPDGDGGIVGNGSDGVGLHIRLCGFDIIKES